MYDLLDRPVDQLPAFERRVLDAMRRYVHAMTLAGAPPRGSQDAAFTAVMDALDEGSRDMLVIQRPCFATVEETEAVILGLWRLTRADRLRQAQDAAGALVDAPHAARMVAAMTRVTAAMSAEG